MCYNPTSHKEDEQPPSSYSSLKAPYRVQTIDPKSIPGIYHWYTEYTRESCMEVTTNMVLPVVLPVLPIDPEYSALSSFTSALSHRLLKMNVALH